MTLKNFAALVLSLALQHPSPLTPTNVMPGQTVWPFETAFPGKSALPGKPGLQACRVTAERAERLGLVLAQLRDVRYIGVEEAFNITPLTARGASTAHTDR